MICNVICGCCVFLDYFEMVHISAFCTAETYDKFERILILLIFMAMNKIEKHGFIANSFNCYLYMNFINIYSKMSEDAPVLQRYPSLLPTFFPPSVFPGKLNLKVTE